MLLQNFISAAALGLVGFTVAKPTNHPCGFKIAPCPDKTVCTPNSPYCTDLNRCAGTCVPQKEYPSCGGFRVNPPKCPKGSTCKDDPRIPGSCGMACDAPGICIPNKAPSCSGFAGLVCPKGLTCYDLPNDGCDPLDGGADCIGVCL
ncbi:hypothetical protein G7Z17_g3335 [Cylindrodendrum hubeiense]|uniref:Uncharacterized protein n=1 Tax=Cylindrodendrum hubeiense TaxID=595255 RepID=A0A9P5HB11_9HYPO|nr:hypothetical protein G7Z17_g3335 [Cylindrodendrum hubeiense]